jgi:chloramphenicol 3-O phosphotransferase
VLVEPDWLRQCAELLADLPAYLIAVDCPLEVLEERERSRKDRTLGQAKAQYPIVHAGGIYDLRVDTSIDDPQECARKVISRIQDGPQVALMEIREILNNLQL